MGIHRALMIIAAWTWMAFAMAAGEFTTAATVFVGVCVLWRDDEGGK
jgi:hypothetical protein